MKHLPSVSSICVYLRLSVADSPRLISCVVLSVTLGGASGNSLVGMLFLRLTFSGQKKKA